MREYVLERERFQTTHHERDLETNLDYRGARFYDGDVGRFLSVDPLASDYAAWSTYAYVLGNPIRNIDPDGRSVENIGVDNNGNVVFDDGKDDGNLYLVNDNAGKITNLENLQQNSTQLAENGKWIGTDEQLVDYVRSQGNHIENAGAALLPTIPISFEPTTKGDFVGTTTAQLSGNTVSPKESSDFSLTLHPSETKRNEFFNNPYNTRNVLEHEMQHVVQGVKTFHRQETFSNSDYQKIVTPKRELEAVKVQRQASSWKSTTGEFKKIVNRYEKFYKGQ